MPTVAPAGSRGGIAAEYDVDLFVPPNDAYQRVLSHVRKWKKAHARRLAGAKVWRARQRSAPMSPGDQVLCLVGERGVGKTWLLRHLAVQDGEVAPLAVYVDLEQRTDFAQPQAFVEAVQEQVGQKRGKARPILLLDTVPHELDAYLRALEESVLQAHLAERGALVIMALVHPSRACWRAPALRGGENIWVLPFDPSQTRTQLRGLERAGLARSRLAVSYVQDYSGGLALLNYLLARCEQRHAFELLLDYCFSRIPAHECNRVKSYLEALCVLEVLEHAAIQRVLAVYHRRRPGARLSPTQAGEARNVLRKYWLARSTPDTPGRVVLVESVRRAAREVLKERDAELYAALNEAAHATPGGRR